MILTTSHSTKLPSCAIRARLSFAKDIYLVGMDTDPLGFFRGFHAMNMESVSIQDGPCCNHLPPKINRSYPSLCNDVYLFLRAVGR